MSRALQSILTAYAVAGAMGVAVAYAVAFEHPIVVAFAADAAATCTIFAFSFAFRNSSFYDAYWSAAPPIIGAYWLLCDPVTAVPGGEITRAAGTRHVVVLGLVAVWAARLTWNWYRGWKGLDHEDWRYRNIQQQAGKAYWLVSFAGIHMAPTLWVFLGCLPLYPALALSTRPFGALDWVAALVTSAAIALEARADGELARFKRSGAAPGTTLTTGVWRLSRHPNYLGEMGFWWGLLLFGVAADPSWWWTAIGAVSITGMFRFVSLPLIENRMLETHPDYAAYAARTPRVIPRPIGS